MLCDEKLLKLSEEGHIPGPNEDEESFLSRIESVNFDVIYSNAGLSPFEAAVTWIDHSPQIQLRKVFQNKANWLGYSKSEILEHERLHLARAAFDEPLFEEILAYSLSPKKYRRLLGPFFRNRRNVYISMMSLISATWQPILGLIAIALGFTVIRDLQRFAKVRRRYPLKLLMCLTDSEIMQLAKNKPIEWGNSLRHRLVKRLYKLT
ncbi:MAG: hypothetical protein MRY21_01095 [Simkaniaceae bacterium]|nr:hypothetical protein [Simkaniaceae bacterium]